MALLTASLLFLRTHFRRVLFSRRIALCALIACGPAVLASLVLSTPQPDAPSAVEIVTFPGWFVLLQIVVPVVSLIAGSAVISEEIEDRTITFLFTRPFPRAALLLGRWSATALILALLLGGSALLLGLVVATLAKPGDPLPHADVTVPLCAMAIGGGAVYSALFAVVGVFLRRPMIVGLAYSFVIEGLLANLPGKSQGLTVLYHLRSYVASASPSWRTVLENAPMLLEPQAASLTWLAVVALVALVLGSWGVSRRQFELTA